MTPARWATKLWLRLRIGTMKQWRLKVAFVPTTSGQTPPLFGRAFGYRTGLRVVKGCILGPGRHARAGSSEGSSVL